jgi:sulfotransferase
MSKTFYFMAGLPRSGSTLLSSILNQNPRFYSGPSSPVLGAMYALEANFTGNELYEGYPKPAQVDKIIGSVIENFYDDIDKPVVIDKNRAWTARVPYIEGYIKQQAKIIVPVRSVDEILASMLTMIHRNPFKEGQARINFVDEQLVKQNIPINDTNRCYHLLNPGGIVHDSLDAIMRGFSENFKDRMHFVDYNNLTTDPHRELDKIYEFLGEPHYNHTFDSLSNLNRENDLNTYGISDMHHVRSELRKTSQSPSKVLPSEILELYYQSKDRLEFWGTPSIIKVKAPPTKENKVQMGTFLGTVI